MKAIGFFALSAGIVLASDPQTDALIYVNDPNANLDWLNFCYNYPFYMFVGRESTALSYDNNFAPFNVVRSLFVNTVGMFKVTGGTYSEKGCVGWADVTDLPGEEMNYKQIPQGLDYTHNKAGYIQSVARGMVEGVLRADYAEGSLENVLPTFSTLHSYTETTTLNPLLNVGTVPIALVQTSEDLYDRLGTQYSDPESVECVDQAPSKEDYHTMMEYWNVPIVVDQTGDNTSSDLSGGAVTVIRLAYNTDFQELDIETQAYVYAYYMCNKFYDRYYPETTTTTVPPTTTTGYIITQPPNTTISKNTDSGTIVSAAVGAAAGAGVLGLGYYLMQNQCTAEVETELEEPEIFGSGTYDYEDEEPAPRRQGKENPAGNNNKSSIQVVTSELE